MTLRLALAAVIVAACGLCGAALARAEERRWRMLRDTVSGLKRLRVQIVHLREPLARALKQSGAQLLAATAEHLDGAPCAAEAWRQTWSVAGSRGGAGDCLSAQDVRALERLFDRLGESGCADQDAAIRACAAELEEAAENARQRAMATSRLYTSLGLLLGLALAVLVV